MSDIAIALIVIAVCIVSIAVFSGIGAMFFALKIGNEPTDSQRTVLQALLGGYEAVIAPVSGLFAKAFPYSKKEDADRR